MLSIINRTIILVLEISIIVNDLVICQVINPFFDLLKKIKMILLLFNSEKFEFIFKTERHFFSKDNPCRI